MAVKCFYSKRIERDGLNYVFAEPIPRSVSLFKLLADAVDKVVICKI